MAAAPVGTSGVCVVELLWPMLVVASLLGTLVLPTTVVVDGSGCSTVLLAVGTGTEPPPLLLLLP